MPLPLDGQILQAPRSPERVDIAPPRVWDERLRAVLPSTSRLLSLYADATWAEGPVWWPEGRSLIFSDVIGRRTLAWRDDGSIVTVRDRSNFANGNAMDAAGRLVQAEHGRRGISRTDTRGTELLVDRYEGEPLNSPNDLVVASDGAIWFTDPTYGISDPREGYPADPALPHQSVYRWRDGEGLRRMIDLDQPNGLAFSRDERILYIAESNAEGLPRVVACEWDGETLGPPRTFATVDAGIPDGFAVDSRDWLWISSEAGVVVVDEVGRRLGVIPHPARREQLHLRRRREAPVHHGRQRPVDGGAGIAGVVERGWLRTVLPSSCRQERRGDPSRLLRETQDRTRRCRRRASPARGTHMFGTSPIQPDGFVGCMRPEGDHMKTLPTRVRGGMNTFLYGGRTVRCQTCGTAVRPSRAVWRGARPYCSARHEHADAVV